jgi:hypothetical protein
MSVTYNGKSYPMLRVEWIGGDGEWHINDIEQQQQLDFQLARLRSVHHPVRVYKKAWVDVT